MTRDDTIPVFVDTLYFFEIDTAYFTGHTDDFNLLLAADKDDGIAMEILLRRGADPKATTYYGVTALMYAVQNNDIQAVEMLIYHGADVNAIPDNEATAIISASKNGDYPISQILLDNDADVNQSDEEGFTPLMYASAYNYDALAELYLENGADPAKKDWSGSDALIIASYYGSFETARVLLDYDADVNTEDKNGFTPLMIASQNGHYDMAWLLISEQADINHKNKDGNNALSMAVIYDYEDIADLLLESGAKPNEAIGTTTKIIDFAESSRNSQMDSLLIAYGAKKNFIPDFSIISGGFQVSFNLDDGLIGPQLGLIDSKYGLMINGKFLFRPAASRVLVTEDKNSAYQFWERRFMIAGNLDKIFNLFTIQNSKIGIYGGAGVGFTWGSYRGADRKPIPHSFFMPNAGLQWRTDVFGMQLEYEYANVMVENISPHRINFSLNFYINSGKDRFKPKEINVF